MDSLLDSISVDTNEPSPPSNSQELAEERNLKTIHSPKASQTQSLKNTSSPKVTTSSPKETCSGEKKLTAEISDSF